MAAHDVYHTRQTRSENVQRHFAGHVRHWPLRAPWVRGTGGLGAASVRGSHQAVALRLPSVAFAGGDGRSGADEGFDACAAEIVPVERDGGERRKRRTPRLSASVSGWVQCKREKAIGAQKLVGYLVEIAEPAELYGIVFAAACDFSKTA